MGPATRQNCLQRRIRAGVCGFGAAASWFHLPLLRELEFELAAAFDPVASRREAALACGFRAAHDADRLERTIGEEALDVVIVCSPSALHDQQVRTALRGGAHVIVDKPATTEPRGFDELLHLARAAGRVVVPFHNRRYDRDHQAVAGAVARGEAGRLLRIETSVARWGPSSDYAVREFLPRWRTERAWGGGVLADWAPHKLDQLLDLVPAGARPRIAAASSSGFWSGDCEDVVDALLQWPDVTVHLVLSLAENAPKERMRVTGTKATITVEGGDAAGVIRTHRAGMEPAETAYRNDVLDALPIYRAVAAAVSGDPGEAAALAARGRDAYALVDAVRDAARGSGPARRPRPGSALRTGFVDGEEWDELVSRSPAGTVFHSRLWTNHSPHQFARLGVWSGRTLLAGAIVQVDADGRGCRGTLAPYLGPIVAEQCRAPEASVRALAAAMPSLVPGASFATSPWAPSLQPFVASGAYTVRLLYTSVLDLHDLASARSRFASMLQRNLKLAVRELTVEPSDEAEPVLGLVARTFARQGAPVWFDLREAKQCLHAAAAAGWARHFIARDGRGNAVAGAAVLADRHRAYYLLGGYDHERAHRAASSAALWAGIEWARNELGVAAFDLEGSHLPHVERFFRQFGGDWLPFAFVRSAEATGL